MQATTATSTEYRCYTNAFLLFSILSICVGILVFVNGMINCFDQGRVANIQSNQRCYDCGTGSLRSCPSICQTSNPNYLRDPASPLPINGKHYMCGGINFWNLNTDEQDSGFFFRVHEIIRTPYYEFPSATSFEKMYYVDAFPFLMTLAIVCGTFWIISGSIGIVAYIMYSRTLVAVATGICQVNYLIYIIFFSIVWSCVLYISNDCYEYMLYGTEGNYNSFQGHATRSSTNFLVYSIIAFVVEFFTILVGIKLNLIFVPVEVIPQEYSLRKVVIPPGYSANTTQLPADNSIRQIVLDPPKYNYQGPPLANPQKYVTPLPYSTGFV